MTTKLDFFRENVIHDLQLYRDELVRQALIPESKVSRQFLWIEDVNQCVERIKAHETSKTVSLSPTPNDLQKAQRGDSK